jgi:DNA-binding SARP family transcriptional activator
MAVRIEVLGAVRVRVDDQEVAPGPPLRRAVLAMLSLRAGRLVTLGELVQGLWGDAAPASAEGSVYTYISGLRSILDPERSGRDRGGILDGARSGYTLLIDPADVDALAAEQYRLRARELRESGALAEALSVLDQAIGLWRGEALAGVGGPFAEAERARLTGLRWALLEERAEIALALGQHVEIVAELTALVRQQPMRERLVGVTMTVLYRAGRQADAIDMFQQVRAILAGELGVDPSPALSRLYEQILRSDPALDTPKRDRPAVASARVPKVGRVVPAQLPHDVASFTGREAEVSWLRALVSSELAGEIDGMNRSASVVISAIDGCGGIGKTALAVHLAHQVRAEFPDGQLCVDLRGFDPQLPPLSPVEALSRLMQGLGAETSDIPNDLDVQAGHYRSLIAGKRLLILLDNAVSTEQVKELLPGAPGCLVLVTSRNRLGGLVARHGARRLTLDVLTESDAVTLLTLVIGVERSSGAAGPLAELAELCGRFPLALRIAAERVITGGSHTIGDLVEELRFERARLDLLTSNEDETSAVGAVFSWSYHALKAEVGRMFRLLSVHSGPEFTVEVAAAIAGVSVGDARQLLRTLTDGHLLEDAGIQRYRFHDLLRLYAGERAAVEEPETESRRALQRMLGHYLYTADRAAAQISPNTPWTELDPMPTDVHALPMPDVDSALEWMEREQSALLTAVRQAAVAQEYRLAWQLVERIRALLLMRRTTAECVEILTIGVDCARRLNDRTGRAVLLSQRGFARIRSCEYEAALEDLDRARAIYAELNDRRGSARVLGNIGNVYSFGLQDDDKALQCFIEAEAELCAVADLDGRARALGGIASIYAAKGRYEDALDHGRHALQLFTDLGDVVEMQVAAYCLASYELGAGRPDVALPMLRQSLLELRIMGDKFSLGTCLTDLARCHRELGHLEDALGCAEEAVELLRMRDPGPLGDALIELGRAERGLGRIDDARRTLIEAQQLAGAGDDAQIRRLEAELATLGVTSAASSG